MKFEACGGVLVWISSSARSDLCKQAHFFDICNM
jgi:hypothetical protein